MKTYCKDADITDRNLVSIAVRDCLRGKLNRVDTVSMLARHTSHSREEVKEAIKSGGMDAVSHLIERVIDDCVYRLKARKLDLRPLRYSVKTDPSSQKVREIGVQDIRQQLFDYVAVYSLLPILKRIGEFQCAAISGRGQRYGIKAMRKWVANRNNRYCLKADIRKCYPTTDREKLMAWLRRYVKNEPLLWLVRELIYTSKQGLMIGSYLSQHLANLYLSQLYHFLAEEQFKVRRDKRINMVHHVLFYMDDFVILGSSASDLHKVFRALRARAAELGYEIKPDWRVFEITEKTFVDVMGARIYRDHITLRRRVFLRAKRCFVKVKKIIETHKRLSLPLARKVISYWGSFLHTDAFKIIARLKIRRSVSVSKRVVSYAH